jgi:hypothetical protein
MLIPAIVCFALAVLVLRSKRPAETPNSSGLYRIDNRVVAGVLVILALTFAVLGWLHHRLWF